MSKLKQQPAPGKHLLLYCGDILEFRLESSTPIRGKAYLRTNLGNAFYHRWEIIEHVEDEVTPGFQDWRSLPMNKEDDFTYSIKVMLTQEGHYEAKCYVLDTETSLEPEWPDGDNIAINVEPAAYSSSNGVYCAFVRQFGSNQHKKKSELPPGINTETLSYMDQQAYSVIPSSGTFRSLIRELDHIFGTLHCRILHLLPINPTPTVYGRMGRFGSPYASLDFTGINPELAEFDRSATPLDQFEELVDAVHCRGGKLFIDIAINHTGWAAKLHETHPEWLVKNEDGSIHSPGAWGVTWGDLTELDHSKLELWKYLAGVFRLWCLRGVDGFRCDAGYMIPLPAWEYIIAKIRMEFPEVIFLLEGLGGDPKVTAALLNQANMNWAYSELFQNYSRSEIENYLRYSWKQSTGDGLLIHYAETHDNLRLAATSPEYARMRTALAALASSNGTFGFTNGVEWFATEKIDVHEASALNWGASLNQVDFIHKLNIILEELPCFHHGSVPRIIDSNSESGILISRTDANGNFPVLIAINLNTQRDIVVRWNKYSASFNAERIYDLLSGRQMDLVRESGGNYSLRLPGSAVFCFTDSKKTLEAMETLFAEKEKPLARGYALQEAKSLAASILAAHTGSIVTQERDLLHQAQQLLDSPEDFLRQLNGKDNEVPYVLWRWPEDTRRMVMVPPGYYVLVRAKHRIPVMLALNGHVRVFRNSLCDKNGEYFSLILPLPVPVPDVPTEVKMNTAVFLNGRSVRNESSLMYLPKDVLSIQTGLVRKDFHRAQFHFMRGNGRGGLLWHTIEPDEIRSRYDAVLLANLNADYPEDRHIMLRRFRTRCIYHEKKQDLSRDCMKSFQLDPAGAGIWHFELPVGNGLYADISEKMELLPDKNAVRITFTRHTADGQERRLPDKSVTRLQIRADIEDRSFHNATKASAGPEKVWPDKITSGLRNMTFAPAASRILSLTCSKGHFIRSDKWQYMVWMQIEAERGLDPHCDLYSPGYFELALTGGDSVVLIGQILTNEKEERLLPIQAEPVSRSYHSHTSIENMMLDSMAQFIVKRDEFKTVIAGYPWFLDWGRDTLIAVRGLIAAARFREDAKKILLRFALFVKDGTIPNMISGDNADNRDTSDAPLWLFTACRDLCKAEGSSQFMETPLKNGLTLKQSLVVLAEGILKGTPNGIKAEEQSLLVFSPKHFTWMDTNYPAGTPRQGYPIEIQALWFAALRFLGEILEAPEKELWQKRANTVKESILKYFVLPDKEYLSDCLHCEPGMKPENAAADDHLRPNQLYALTLGAVDDPDLRRKILQACALLLIPGAIRSLDDASVCYKLPIRDKDSHLLNDPAHPYWGHYEGDEDTRRKPAYHNGTAWTWQFPAYCEAFFQTYGEPGKATAKALLASMTIPMNGGCMCQITEIMDGDYPHTQRGCGAQAWSMSEFLRVWKILH